MLKEHIENMDIGTIFKDSHGNWCMKIRRMSATCGLYEGCHTDRVIISGPQRGNCPPISRDLAPKKLLPDDKKLVLTNDGARVHNVLPLRKKKEMGNCPACNNKLAKISENIKTEGPVIVNVSKEYCCEKCGCKIIIPWNKTDELL